MDRRYASWVVVDPIDRQEVIDSGACEVAGLWVVTSSAVEGNPESPSCV
ncbi:hypothetical protein [Streptomyces stackebrandtii]|nr:hypothetical protein [Streptomyces sp. DSM 40976]